MNNKPDERVLTELEDSLHRLEQMMEWRRLRDRIFGQMRSTTTEGIVIEMLEIREGASPTLIAKQRRLLECLKQRAMEGTQGHHES